MWEKAKENPPSTEEPTAADASHDAKQPNAANFQFAPPQQQIPAEIQVHTGALPAEEFKSEGMITPAQLNSPSSPLDMESSTSTTSEMMRRPQRNTRSI